MNPDTVHGALPYAFTHALMHIHEHSTRTSTLKHTCLCGIGAHALGSRLLMAAGYHRTLATI